MRVAIAAVLAVAVLPVLGCQQKPLTFTFSSVVVTGIPNDEAVLLEAVLQQRLEEAGARKAVGGVQLVCTARYTPKVLSNPATLTLIVGGDGSGHDAVATASSFYDFSRLALYAAGDIVDSFRRQEAIRSQK